MTRSMQGPSSAAGEGAGPGEGAAGSEAAAMAGAARLLVVLEELGGMLLRCCSGIAAACRQAGQGTPDGGRAASGGRAAAQAVGGGCPGGALAGRRGGLPLLIPAPHLWEGAQPAEEPQSGRPILVQVVCGVNAGSAIKVKQLPNVEG